MLPAIILRFNLSLVTLEGQFMWYELPDDDENLYTPCGECQPAAVPAEYVPLKVEEVLNRVRLPDKCVTTNSPNAAQNSLTSANYR